MDNDDTKANTIRVKIPVAVVLGLVKGAMPIDATVTSAHLDEATGFLELTVASDYWERSQ